MSRPSVVEAGPGGGASPSGPLLEEEVESWLLGSGDCDTAHWGVRRVCGVGFLLLRGWIPTERPMCLASRGMVRIFWDCTDIAHRTSAPRPSDAPNNKA